MAIRAKPIRRARALLVLSAAILLCPCFAFVPPHALGQSAASQTGSSENSAGKPDEGAPSQDHKTSSPGMTRIRIQVTNANDKPVGNASVYVRYYISGGFLRAEKLNELDLKTNQDGTVKVPEIPQGKVMIQVVAKGWHTFGKWYDINQEEQTVAIKLDPPPHWY